MLGKRWLSVLVVASLATFGLGMSAMADTATEAGFLAEINASRAANGLEPLTVDGGLRTHARNHTQDMIEAGEIFHSTSAELMAAAGSGWSQLAENVGRGGTVSSLHTAFMNSSGHRANILGPYNKVGIGTDTSEGVLYVTVVFMSKGSSSTTTTTAPTSTTSTTSTTKAPAPKPTTTTTTLPPTTTTTTTTTTTLIVGPDKAVTPGVSCVDATRFWWTCHN